MARKRFQKGSVFVVGDKWVGRWMIRVRLEDGSTKVVYRSRRLGLIKVVGTKRQAMRLLQPYLDEVNNQLQMTKPFATFSQFADRWKRDVLVTYKPSTQSDMQSQLRKHLVPFFGKTSLSELHGEEVQEFIASRKTLSPKRVRNLVVTLRLMWKQAKAWRYVTHDLEGVVLPVCRTTEQPYFNEDAVKALIHSASEPYRTFYWLAAVSGMRAGELTGLRLKDIDLENRVVRVERSMWRGKVGAPKSQAGTRRIAIGNGLAEHLKEFLKVWKPNNAGLLFTTRNGTPLDQNLIVKRKLKPLCKKLGIIPAGLHAFRHGMATVLDQIGAPLKVRQKRMGHADPRVTLTSYTHAVSGDDRDVAGKIDRIFQPALLPILHPDLSCASGKSAAKKLEVVESV